jgi:hypothetical protein
VTRTQWVFRHPGGCFFGVLEATRWPTRGGPRTLTRSEAWKAFYDTARERDAAMDRGVSVEHMSHERYVAEVYPQMRGDYRCPHTTTTAEVNS